MAVRLRVYERSIAVVRGTCVLGRGFAAIDPDLARQLRRACMSVPLNMAEGLHSQGRHREARLHTAMGSAQETIACLDVAEAAGYVTAAAVTPYRKELDEIVAILYRLIERRHRHPPP